MEVKEKRLTPHEVRTALIYELHQLMESISGTFAVLEKAREEQDGQNAVAAQRKMEKLLRCARKDAEAVTEYLKREDEIAGRQFDFNS